MDAWNKVTFLKVTIGLAIVAPMLFGYSVDRGKERIFVENSLSKGCYPPEIEKDLIDKYHFDKDKHPTFQTIGLSEHEVKKFDVEKYKQAVRETLGREATDKEIEDKLKKVANSKVTENNYPHKIPVVSQSDVTNDVLWADKLTICRPAQIKYNFDHRTISEVAKDAISNPGEEASRWLSNNALTLFGSLWSAFLLAGFLSYLHFKIPLLKIIKGMYER